MSEKDFLPVESSRLSDFFPELKHFILANYSRTFTIKKGGQIPLADNPDELLYLATGKVKAYMFDDEGHERLLYIFIKDTLIFHSVSEQYCKNLVTLEKATLYSIPLTDVFAFLQSDAAFIRKYSALIAARYGILLQQVLTTNRLGAKSKVYSFLISLVHKYGTLQENGSYLVSKFPTLTDLASLTDVHRSNVTSYINSLETQGIIHRQKKQLIVNDLEALERWLKKADRKNTGRDLRSVFFRIYHASFSHSQRVRRAMYSILVRPVKVQPSASWVKAGRSSVRMWVKWHFSMTRLDWALISLQQHQRAS